MPELRVLVLTGNSVVNQIPSYRKTLILNCKSLTYLDTLPVFDVDRACAEAWKRGGYEEERLERMRWNQEERRKLISSVHNILGATRNGSSDCENNSIGPSKCNESQSNDQQDTASISDETSGSDNSSSKDFEEVPDKNELSKMRVTETTEDFNNSDEFHDVECDEEDSDDSFVSSLEQIVDNPFTENNEMTVTDVDVMNDSVLIEEMEEKTNFGDSAITSEADNNGDYLGKEIKYFLAPADNDNLSGKDVQISQTATKITFFCESVQKLMVDTVGDDCDEIIQEIAPILPVDSV